MAMEKILTPKHDLIIVKESIVLFVYLCSTLNQLLIYKLCYSINSKLQRDFHSELMQQSYLWVRYMYYRLFTFAKSVVKFC